MGPNSCQYGPSNQLGLNSIVFFGNIIIYQLNHYDLELQNETSLCIDLIWDEYTGICTGIDTQGDKTRNLRKYQTLFAACIKEKRKKKVLSTLINKKLRGL